jgi:carbon monoxide dehydrogenase subunit G
MNIEDTFEVRASPERAWAFLNDVPEVIPCMPGAELVEVRGDDAWLARLTTKVGPIALRFDTEVTRTAADRAGHRVELKAEAREVRGRGRATATIASSLSPTDGGTRVDIATELALQGSLAQFGRGVVADISAQMTRQFAESLAARLEQESATAGGPSPEGGAPPPAPVAAPVPGLRLVLVSFWRRFTGRFRRGGGASQRD